jgi:branched-chain amino acid transport system ATP-binding protein
MGAMPMAERIGPPALEVRGLNVFYGASHALQGVDLRLDRGVLSVVGRNGMGKTTLCKTIMGLVPAASGSISFRGQPLLGRSPAEVARLGIGYVPQGRRLFSELTVMENLKVGLMTRGSGPEVLEHVLSLFPLLKERLAQRAGTMSGGEQQMLAMGRALMARPKVLLLDEPSMGLSPIMVDKIFEVVADIHSRGTTVLLVEQNASRALGLADRGYVMESGLITMDGDAKTLLNDPKVRAAYLGE